MATAILEEGTFVRVEPEKKRQAESILRKRGMTYYEAVNFFTNEIILRNDLPAFEKPEKLPLPCLEDMSEEEFDALVQEALDEIDTGLGIPAEELERRLSEKYGIEL
ncbi:MAG: hypothetical protein IJR94_07965 [Synergistaceae bacterium]|nr:hypothetical protein [Synergistaceae bacterium]